MYGSNGRPEKPNFTQAKLTEDGFSFTNALGEENVFRVCHHVIDKALRGQIRRRPRSSSAPLFVCLCVCLPCLANLSKATGVLRGGQWCVVQVTRLWLHKWQPFIKKFLGFNFINFWHNVSHRGWIYTTNGITFSSPQSDENVSIHYILFIGLCNIIC